MRRYLIGIGLAALLVVPPQTLSAQTNINYFAQFGPVTTVEYLPFIVSTGGTFQMVTSGLNNVDPMIFLFSGASFNGPGLGLALLSNDDGSFAQTGWNACVGAGGTCHSLISSFLAPGAYTLAMSGYDLSEPEARSGIQGSFPDAVYPGPYCNADADWADCNYSVSLTSDDGTAEVVPEPATMSLLATGLVGLAGLRRRRKQA